MKRRLLEFFAALRDAGLPVITAEALDATRSIAVVGVEPGPFRTALSSCLVKDVEDQPAFDRVFDAFFAVPPRRRRQQRSVDDPGGVDGHGTGGQSGVGRQPREQEQDQHAHRREEVERRSERLPSMTSSSQRERRNPEARAGSSARAAFQMRFVEMTANTSEQCNLLAEALSRRWWVRKRRRARQARSGRLDIRRTIRRAFAHGGTPLEIVLRQPRPRRLNLLVLCDLSHSTAAASSFLLSLLEPAAQHFHRVQLLGFVDTPIEIEVRAGIVYPAWPLDYFARSDFGNVFVELQRNHSRNLGRNTILLVLGDARNNFRSPRPDLLGKIHSQVRRIVWLNPEPIERWNKGDSVMSSYVAHCDALLCADSPRRLWQALRAELA